MINLHGKPQLMALVAVFVILLGYSQEPPRFFGGFEAYRNIDFDTGFYYNINPGVELLTLDFFAPEVGFNWFTGTTENIQSTNPQTNFTETFTRKTFHAWTICFSPKLVLELEKFKVYLLPSYNLGRNSATGSLFETSNNGITFQRVERGKVSGRINFFSFAAGVELPITNDDKLSLGIHFLYTRFNGGEAFSEINLPISGISLNSERTETLGIGFKLYFNPFDED